MNSVGATFVCIAALLTLTLPRRLAALPLLLSACYMTRGQVLEIGPANFTVPQLLVTAGFIRVAARGEQLTGGLQAVDRLLLLWASMLIATSAFHTSDAWVYRSGIVWTELGCYFLLRIFLQSLDQIRATFGFLCVALLPLAAAMLIEKETGHNLFGDLGGVVAESLVRDDRVRAAGPFAHPILAGTVGATLVGMALALRKCSRPRAACGLLAGAGIIVAATSSGPILMVVFFALGLLAWPLRRHMRALRWTALLALLILNAAMEDPVYFLIARIDITGGSQGYYRAQLIRSALEHASEWWLAGTDFTRHWMATGNHANTRHTDITNHVLAMGVLGGLPLMTAFVLVLIGSFKSVGSALAAWASAPAADQSFVWGLGALLFAFVMNFLSISLYDQSIMFFYLCLASIQSVARKPAPGDVVPECPAARYAPTRYGTPSRLRA